MIVRLVIMGTPIVRPTGTVLIALLTASGCGESERDRNLGTPMSSGNGGTGGSNGNASAGGGGATSSGDEGNSNGNGGRAGSNSVGGASAGGIGGLGSVPETGPIPIASFAEAYTQASCELLMKCPFPDGWAQQHRLLLADEALCANVMLGNVANMVDPWIQGVNDGTLEYDAVAARRCVNRLPWLCGLYPPHDYTRAFGLLCEDVFEGGIAPGGDCRQDVECAGSAFCQEAGLYCSPCTEREPAGGSCAFWEQCSSIGADGGACIDGRCYSVTVEAPSVGMNETCGFVRDADYTARLVTCAEGFWCQHVPVGVPRGTCVPEIPKGAECGDWNEVCEDGSVCMAGATGMSCQVISVRAVDESCVQSDYCSTGASCLDGICVTFGDGAEGSACTELLASGIVMSRSTCQKGTYCDTLSGGAFGTCTKLGGEGEPCFYSYQCLSGQCDSGIGCAPAFCSP